MECVCISILLPLQVIEQAKTLYMTWWQCLMLLFCASKTVSAKGGLILLKAYINASRCFWILVFWKIYCVILSLHCLGYLSVSLLYMSLMSIERRISLIYFETNSSFLYYNWTAEILIVEGLFGGHTCTYVRMPKFVDWPVFEIQAIHFTPSGRWYSVIIWEH